MLITRLLDIENKRYWESALRAAEDVGIEITSTNRTTDTILGQKGSTSVDIFVMRQSDGRIRVELNLRRLGQEDPYLADEFYRAFDRYMGKRY